MELTPDLKNNLRIRPNQSPLAVRYYTPPRSCDPSESVDFSPDPVEARSSHPPLRRQSTLSRLRHAFMIFLIRLFRCF